MKNLAEMNLVDNFLFGTVMDHEEAGKLVGKTILETILHREIRIKSVNPEKTIWSSDTDFHGIRLDAYIEEEGTADISPGNVYDLEPDQKVGEKKKLPKRCRFYHSNIDLRLLQSGDSYDKFPSAMVIFITTFDPFGENRMVYTIRNHCVELPEMDYEDGAVTIFLYTKGETGNPPEDLQVLLKYLSETRTENACSPELNQIQGMIDEMKKDPRIRRRYMDMKEYIERERREAVEEALIEEKEHLEAEKHRADEEKRRADEEKCRADAAEAEVLRLRALLKNAGITE